jgi:hypothetical protein
MVTMLPMLTLAIGLGMAVLPFEARDEPELTPATWTGWFSDKGCAAPRVAKGILGPNNPSCVKRCLGEGATPVFISEQTKEMYEVKGDPPLDGDVFYHVEVSGTVDREAKTIAIRSVKRLSYIGAMCARPAKKKVSP